MSFSLLFWVIVLKIKFPRTAMENHKTPQETLTLLLAHAAGTLEEPLVTEQEEKELWQAINTNNK